MNPRIDDLIALAALGELTAAETRELDAAADAQPEVAAELGRALAAAAVLQATARELPPERLRASVLDTIATTEQHVPVVEFVPEPASNVVSITMATAGSRRRFAPLLGAVAAVLLLLVVAGGLVVSQADRGSNDQVAAVLESSDVMVRTLDGTLGGELEVAYSSTEGALVITGSGVGTLSDDTTYQLWLVDDDGATSVGTFRPDDAGEVRVRFDDVDPSGSVVGVTREPAGGSEAPTLPILAAA